MSKTFGTGAVVDGDVWMDTSGVAPSITTTTLSGLNKNAPTSQLLVASGTLPLIWSLISGDLPAGLTLSDAGELYGTTPSQAYTVDVTSVNTPTTIAAGQLNARVDIRETTSGEWISFDVVKIPVNQSL